ncbi:NADH dehydrogenase [ubiquinone] 1 beta subcomplex subunit 10-like [Lineus longissimus]|uniref:NADH dehydrogenase [ubiquinone] 1 beta subcomplex subunit 10-like n=1 Tax=Lineus longissimus TaxID=88925 RepID=UPI002B4C4284
MSDDDKFFKRDSSFVRFFNYPITAFREKFVEPMQKRNPYPYYHRKFRRVPTVDQCAVDDPICLFEAQEQYKRDKRVDQNIVKILRLRRNECMHWEGSDFKVHCKKEMDDYDEGSTNYFIKYGDIGVSSNVSDAYMKQKHRMVWERRHGPVGSGMKPQE